MYFKDKEFECKCGCGYNDISPTLREKLNAAREEAGVPFIITSGCRCEAHNKAVGGVANSSHTKGLAVDISATSSTRYKIGRALLNNFSRVLIDYNRSFIHVDVDTTKPQNVLSTY